MDNDKKMVPFPCGCGGYELNLGGRTEDFVMPCPLCRRLAMFRPLTGAAELLRWYAVDELPRGAGMMKNIDRVGAESREPVTGGGWFTEKFRQPKGNKLYTGHGKKTLQGVFYRINGRKCLAHEKNGEVIAYSTVEDLLEESCSGDLPELTLPF